MSEPSPIWILRHHSPSPVHVVRLVRLATANQKAEHTFVLAGDEKGRVSFTLVNDLRPRYFWQAHEQSILGLDVLTFPVRKEGEDGDRQQKTTCIVTQGRDNKLNAFALSTQETFPSLSVLPSRIQQDLPVPRLLFTIEINALNFCPFSTLGDMIAVPHTLDSGYVDVIRVPSKQRIARALGQADIQSSATSTQRAPMCMTMHLLPSRHREIRELFQILAGYEDGYMRLWSCESVDGEVKATLCWASRHHSESVMSSTVCAEQAVSVAADDQIVLYDAMKGERKAQTKCKSMGNASVCIRQDGKRIAVGGWDGCVRIYDETLKHTSTLRYHKDTVQSISFLEIRALPEKDEWHQEGIEGDDDDDAGSIVALRGIDETKLLISAGREGRICLWNVA